MTSFDPAISTSTTSPSTTTPAKRRKNDGNNVVPDYVVAAAAAAAAATVNVPDAAMTATPPNPASAIQHQQQGSGPIAACIDSSPVRAYAKLEGDGLSYYVRTLHVSLGRQVSNPENVDIPLGNTKSVSRQHARLYYNFHTQRFELTIYGKNGAFVNEQFVEKGVTVPLENKTKIQIGEMAFQFLLPRMTISKPSASNNNLPPTIDSEDFNFISSTPSVIAPATTTAAAATPQQLEKRSMKRMNIEDLIDPAGATAANANAPLDEDNTLSAATAGMSKDVKPPYSYAALIAQAITSSTDKKMTLNGIYNFITTHYPYYQISQNGWQNSIRHNLSLNKAFVKVPRSVSEPGKGAFWTIDNNVEPQFMNGIYKKNKRTSIASTGPAATTSQSFPSASSAQSTATATKKEEFGSARKKIKKEHPSPASVLSASATPAINPTVETDPLVIDEPMTDISGSTKPEPEDVGMEEVIACTVPEVTTTVYTTASTSTAIPSVNGASDAVELVTTTPDKDAETNPEQQATTSSTQPTTSITPSTPPPPPQPQLQPNLEAQAKLQEQLQNTIRQYLLDPIRYPLPASILEALPQAMTQLTPQLAAALKSALKKKDDEEKIDEIGTESKDKADPVENNSETEVVNCSNTSSTIQEANDANDKDVSSINMQNGTGSHMKTNAGNEASSSKPSIDSTATVIEQKDTCIPKDDAMTTTTSKEAGTNSIVDNQDKTSLAD